MVIVVGSVVDCYRFWRLWYSKVKAIFRIPKNARFKNGGKDTIEGGLKMEFKAILHPAEEGGYWAEVPVLPGCATQGETIEEVKQNLKQAILGVLGIDEKMKIEKNAQIMKLVL